MKKQDIHAGQAYTDGKGNVRIVIAVGPQYVLYDGQRETNNLRYRITSKARGPGKIGDERNSTRQSFASWAKELIGYD